MKVTNKRNSYAYSFSPIAKADWEIVFTDEFGGEKLSMLANYCRLPNKRKDIETFRGGNVHLKKATVTHTDNLDVSFYIEKESIALDYLNDWFYTGGKRNLLVYLISTELVNKTKGVIEPNKKDAQVETKRLRKWAIIGAELVELQGLSLDSNGFDILVQPATFSVDKTIYMNPNDKTYSPTTYLTK